MPEPKKMTGISYTYGDYCTWSDEIRCELIDGEVFDMTPGPGRLHQELSMEFATQLHSFFKGKPCRVYAAPFDVRLPNRKEADEEIKTVVQPDIVVVCDESKLDDKGCRGAPDLIVEIVSPSTSSKDHVRKLNLYEHHGVREFWIVDPNGDVMRFNLGPGGRYGRPLTFDRTMTLTSEIFPGLSIILDDVFPKPPKSVRQPPPTFG
ncbi:MAG TPA: Uma2 family endonuclease [Candidatus Ozemobacteraceae bacterium]|nr:Uma2 family endonuclease [Candidatus Ozemobacteraceae bacterium]